MQYLGQTTAGDIIPGDIHVDWYEIVQGAVCDAETDVADPYTTVSFSYTISFNFLESVNTLVSDCQIVSGL